jgi:hypothetical protein
VAGASSPSAPISKELAGASVKHPSKKTKAAESAKAYTPTEIPEAAAKLPWPESLAAQVSVLQKLLPAHGNNPEALSACFGKKSPKRTEQITEIIETLQALGQL